MKTKHVTWITLLPLACLVILLAMGVKSQQSPTQQLSKVDSLQIPAGIKLPDSTQIKLVVRAKRLDKLDSLLSLDSMLKASNERAIVNVKKKIARFEQYRKTPIVELIPKSKPSLVVNPPVLPDSIPFKKKPKRSVLMRMKDFINKP
ncbi:hypothetical protein [Dyadobacter sp. 3J3]|uniref:hypothetical protein n=1 Tax=Dyadobacter sp. 3J3 TaxID=2606600 RepID=UPI001357F170|nr:hypothetical protein [Dyadobacter sp. 3J3]